MFCPPLSLPSLLKVREAVEHGRRQGGELVVAQFEDTAGPLGHEREGAGARASVRMRGAA
jgi:hypothetical protein